MRPEVDPATSTTTDYWLAGTNESFSDPVLVPMEVYGTTWTFYAMPEGGWAPAWRKPLLAAVVLVGGAGGLGAAVAGLEVPRRAWRASRWCCAGCCPPAVADTGCLNACPPPHSPGCRSPWPPQCCCC